MAWRARFVSSLSMLRTLLWVSAIALAGCSGSRSTTTVGGGDRHPPEPAPTPEVPPAPPGHGFDRFLLTGDETPCPPQAHGDCGSSAELVADGTLRMDPWGEPGAPALSARVSDAERDRAVLALGAPALRALLAQPSACAGANQTQTMLVRLAGTDHRNATGYCNDAPIQAARAAIQALTTAHFPDHSLISPPF